MTEMDAPHYCEKCKKVTSHLFSGSGRKAYCNKCGHKLKTFTQVV